MDKQVAVAFFSMLIGFIWGANIFYPSPKDDSYLKKQGAISVYEGRTKCEKALDTWVCKTQKGDI